jgi:hypothetical protein
MLEFSNSSRPRIGALPIPEDGHRGRKQQIGIYPTHALCLWQIFWSLVLELGVCLSVSFVVREGNIGSPGHYWIWKIEREG